MTELTWPPSRGRVTMMDVRGGDLCSPVAIDDTRHEAYVVTSRPALHTIDLRSGRVAGDPIELPATATWSGRWHIDSCCVLPDARRVFVNGGDLRGVVVVDLEARSVARVPGAGGNAVIADVATGVVIAAGGHGSSGQAVVFDARTLATRATLELAAHNDVSIAIDPAGRRAFVAGGQTAAIDVIDLDALEVIHVIASGSRGTGGIAVDPATGTLYANDSISGTVRLFAGREDGRLLGEIEQAIGSGWWGVADLDVDPDSAALVGTSWSQRGGSQLVAIDLLTRRHLYSPRSLFLDGFGATGIAFDRFLRRHAVVSPMGRVALVDALTASPIARAHHRLGGDAGWLGAGVDEEAMTPNGRGRYRSYARGSIHWSPPTGAHETHGAIRDRWAAVGWETGALGFPASDEQVCADGIGRWNDFEHGSIYWTPTTGAHVVHGPIGARWTGIGRERMLGYPLAGRNRARTGSDAAAGSSAARSGGVRGPRRSRCTARSSRRTDDSTSRAAGWATRPCRRPTCPVCRGVASPSSSTA